MGVSELWGSIAGPIPLGPLFEIPCSLKLTGLSGSWVSDTGCRTWEFAEGRVEKWCGQSIQGLGLSVQEWCLLTSG